METQPSVQSPFQKLNFGNNSEKVSKSRHQSFFVLSKFTGFLYFVPKILFRIVDKVSVFGVILVRIFCIRTEYAEIRISPYSVRMWEIWTGIISNVYSSSKLLFPIHLKVSLHFGQRSSAMGRVHKHQGLTFQGDSSLVKKVKVTLLQLLSQTHSLKGVCYEILSHDWYVIKA